MAVCCAMEVPEGATFIVPVRAPVRALATLTWGLTRVACPAEVAVTTF